MKLTAQDIIDLKNGHSIGHENNGCRAPLPSSTTPATPPKIWIPKRATPKIRNRINIDQLLKRIALVALIFVLIGMALPKWGKIADYSLKTSIKTLQTWFPPKNWEQDYWNKKGAANEQDFLSKERAAEAYKKKYPWR